MAYGQNNQSNTTAKQTSSTSNQSHGYPVRGQASQKTTNTAPQAPEKRVGKPENRLFSLFKNKNGNGYSGTLKEDIVIKAGTRVGFFSEDTITGKDGTQYQIMNVNILPDMKKQD